MHMQMVWLCGMENYNTTHFLGKQLPVMWGLPADQYGKNTWDGYS